MRHALRIRFCLWRIGREPATMATWGTDATGIGWWFLMATYFKRGCYLHTDEAKAASLEAFAAALQAGRPCCLMNEGEEIWLAARDYVSRRGGRAEGVGMGQAAGRHGDGLGALEGGAAARMPGPPEGGAAPLGLGDLLAGGRLLVHSSGTTAGSSKQVVYDTGRFLAGMREVARRLALSPRRLAASYVNPRYAYGLSIVASHALAGQPVALLDDMGERDLARLVEAARAGGGSGEGGAGAEVGGAPEGFEGFDVYLTPAQAVTFLLRRVRLPAGVPQARFLFAGDRLSGKVAQALAKAYPGAAIANMYGQVELGPRVTTLQCALDAFVEGDIGTPLEGVRVRVADPGEDGAGRLQVQSDYQMLGYVGAPPLPPPEGGNWVDTGDIARMNPGGGLSIVGRSGRHVNLAGKRINLSDFERCAIPAPGVLNCKARPAGEAMSRVRLVLQVAEGDRGKILSDVAARLQEEFGGLSGFIELAVYDETEHKKGAGKL
jgi:hypothetical protein